MRDQSAIPIRLEIECSRPDRIGKRTVFAFRGNEQVHRDLLSTDDAAARQRFRESCAEKLGPGFLVAGEIDDDIMAAADLVDNTPGPAEGMIGKPKLVVMSSVAPQRVRWIWPGKIPAGKLTIFSGDPGLGKSLMTADISARITRGLPWPDGSQACEAGSVIILTAEDGLADTLRPRLDAAGADPSKVASIVAVGWYDTESQSLTERSFSLVQDLAALESAIREVDECRAVFIDPLSAYLQKTDSHRDADVRAVLAPVADLAERTGVAIIGVSHLNKGSGPAMYRSMGSLAFVAAARAVWGIVRDKQDRDRRLMLPVKCNLAKDATGLSYSVVEVDGVPVLAWSPDPVRVNVDEAMSNDRDEEQGERQSAVEWLRETLASGPVTSEQMQRLAKAAGHAWRTIKRAKDAAGAESYKDGFGSGAIWYWRLRSVPKGAIEGQHQDVALFGEDGPLRDTYTSPEEREFDEFLGG